MNERLYRSRDDRVIAGVCGGLAARFDADPSLVRLAYAIVWLFTGIFPLTVVYVLAVIIVPEEPGGWPAVPPVPGVPPAPPEPGAPPVPPTPGASPADEAAFTAPPATAGATAGGDWYADQQAGREARRAARREARARRGSDPLPAIIAGVVLVGLGAWLLLRDVLAIRWDVVWPVAIIALGVLLVVLALWPRSRGGSGGA